MSDPSRNLPEFIRSYGYAMYTADGTGLFTIRDRWPMAQRVDDGVVSVQDGEPVKIDAQTVADYIQLQYPHGTPGVVVEDEVEGLCLAPPYPFMVLHYDRSMYEPNTMKSFRGQTAVFVASDRIEDIEDRSTRMQAWMQYPLAHWIVSIGVVTHVNGRLPTMLPHVVSLMLDKDGKSLGLGTTVLCAISDPRAAEIWKINVMTEVLTIVHALAFMHVKHSKIEPVEHSKAQVKKAKRKGKTLHRHHKLVVKPLETHMERVRQHNLTPGSKKALHMVRGHFATYTEDAPLLGKFVGTVWRAPHWRGLEDEGVVTKDYVTGDIT